MVYHIGICDDDAFMLKLNRLFIEEVSQKLGLHIVIHEFNSGDAIIHYVGLHELHLLYLDIDMEEAKGLRLADELHRLKPFLTTVFISSSPEHAIHAFEMDAVDYLVKPYVVNRMEKSIRKAILMVGLKRSRILNSTLIITEDSEKIKISQGKIVVIEKQGNQCIIHQVNQVNRCYSSIKKMMEQLEDYFIQVNEGIIVNVNYIRSIEKSMVVMKPQKAKSLVEQTYKIGRRYLPELKERFYGL